LNPERLAENIKGYCTEEIVGQHFAGFFSAEDVERGESKKIVQDVDYDALRKREPSLRMSQTSRPKSVPLDSYFEIPARNTPYEHHPDSRKHLRRWTRWAVRQR
jgi:hypothetical protein